jgi:chloramphenicol-sensitive protein RarD
LKQGILLAIGAHFTWGILLIYWKLLHGLPALQLVSHRIVWSFIILSTFILITKQWKSFWLAITRRRIIFIYFASALLIGVNWLTYIWAVNTGYIVETTLGYFINPLFSVLLGVVVLRERLRRFQYLPVILAIAGFAYLTVVYGHLPWIALMLAVSFGLYGLVKKTASLDPLFGITLETGILLLPAIGWLVFSEISEQGILLCSGIGSDILLVGTGLVTIAPLLMFASAAQRIPLYLLGIIQYIAPSIQFLLGVFVFKESFPHSRLIGFCIVWVALLLFWGESMWMSKKHENNR